MTIRIGLGFWAVEWSHKSKKKKVKQRQTLICFGLVFLLDLIKLTRSRKKNKVIKVRQGNIGRKLEKTDEE